MPISQPSRRRWLGLGPIVLAFAVAHPAAAESSPAAADLVRKMIAAHGGMERWSGAPAVSFVDEFRSGASEEGNPSRVVVEQGSRRAYIDFPGTEMRMAWDGERAWSENWQAPMPPRFLALLNYYFLNLPWMTQDPGVVLGEPGRARIAGDPTDYLTVRMTFDEGVGDTPDDDYLLYIDPETHLLKANEYTVTYAAVLPEGVEASPPHLLIYDEYSSVGGLVVPTHYTIYEEGSVYASCAIREWSFEKPFDPSRLRMPEEAVVDLSVP